MKNFLIARVIPIFLALLGGFLIFSWLRSDVTTDFAMRLPGEDGSENALIATEPIEIKGQLIKLEGTAANLPGAWPRFRGSNFDGISSQEISLATSWPEQGPPLLWSIDVGEGHAGAAILAGRVYVLDYDRENKSDVIRCLSLADGNDIWRYSYPVKVKRNH